MSLALTVGGALVLMAGVSLVLIGEAMRLERPAGLPQLVMAGVVLTAAGLALALVCALVVLSGRQSLARTGTSRQPGETVGYAAPDSAAEWLGPLRDAAVSGDTAYGQASYEQAGYGRAGYEQAGYGQAGYEPAAYEPAGYGQAGYDPAGCDPAGGEQVAAYLTAGNPDVGQVGPQYSDQGWRLDGTGPIARRRPAEPPQEIHHPVRPMPAPRAPGQRLGADTGQLPAYDTGQQPAFNTGQQPAYDSGQRPAYDSGHLPAYDTGLQPAYDTGQRPAYDSEQLPAYGGEAGSAGDTGQHRAYDDDRHSAYLPAPPGG